MTVLLAADTQLRRTRDRRGWRRAAEELDEAAQVLGNGGKRELELRASRSPEPQPSHSKNALQMREQHLGWDGSRPSRDFDEVLALL